MTATKHYIVQSRVRGQWGDLVKYEVRDFAERGLTALRKTVRDQPDRHRHVEGYRLISREYVETVLDPVAEPVEKPVLWKERVAALREKMGRPLTLDELIDLARPYRMTPEEIEAQRQSWARQDMD